MQSAERRRSPCARPLASARTSIGRRDRQLEEGVELAPAGTRFGYVLAVALAGTGQRDEAITVLEATLKGRPNDTGALQALAGYLREAGQSERAADERRELGMLAPW
jgi:Flp pilus assembly protein TadD